ncbi:MAG TPA: 50S ribosomal protein L1 [Nitrososphaeraceae archaeon]|jgi:large subunit ribosomal protein L1|nr:50S ribosomal protein L1 [Nitrososphaeraceae archaeon]
MTSDAELKELIEHARRDYKKRNFDQSIDLTIVLKDIDVKKGFSFNEVVHLPNKLSRQATICVVTSGEMGTRARRAEADRIIEVEELDRIGTNKKEAKKLAKSYDFFVSDTSLMSTVGRSLGQFLGPKGKMPTPIPYGAPIESILTRLRSSVRVRVRNQLNVSTKIGDEKMDDRQLIQNASAILSIVEKKLPQGDKNIRNTFVKYTMGNAIGLTKLSKK